jgi:hypothetical protein
MPILLLIIYFDFFLLILIYLLYFFIIKINLSNFIFERKTLKFLFFYKIPSFINLFNIIFIFWIHLTSNW